MVTGPAERGLKQEVQRKEAGFFCLFYLHLVKNDVSTCLKIAKYKAV